MLLALGNDADKIADDDDIDQAGNVTHRVLVDADQAGADERAGIDTGIGRTHDAAVQHAGDANVVHVSEFAGRLRRKIDARHRAADDLIIVDRFDGHVVSQRETDGLVADQLAIAERAIIGATDQSILDGQILNGGTQLRCRPDQQKGARLRGRFAQRHRGDLDGLAGDRRALVGHDGGVAEHDHDAGEGDVELFCDDLSQRGPDAGAEIDMPVEGRDLAGRGDPNEGLELSIGARDGAFDDQPAARCVGFGGRASAHQSNASSACPAARIAARRISIWAPQRQRL